MFIQDSQSVGWDLRTIYGAPTLAERLYALYVLAFVFLVAVWSIKIWRRLGLTSRLTNLRLIQAFQLLRDGQIPELISLARKFKKSAPEAGLRKWAEFASESDRSAFLKVIEDSAGYFKHVADQIGLTINNLRRLFILSVILLAALFFYEAANVFAGVSAEKATGIAALAGAYEEIALRMGAGSLFLGGLYSVYWHFSVRLEHRRRDWERFCAQVRRFEV